ncbi:hypothetical protein FQA39_LY02325 [Lamprigera yunnana]|nr:hypothetical protein FQA39_LY02325 [Lamprigera yunnana]
MSVTLQEYHSIDCYDLRKMEETHLKSILQNKTKGFTPLRKIKSCKDNGLQLFQMNWETPEERNSAIQQKKLKKAKNIEETQQAEDKIQSYDNLVQNIHELVKMIDENLFVKVNINDNYLIIYKMDLEWSIGHFEILLFVGFIESRGSINKFKFFFGGSEFNIVLEALKNRYQNKRRLAHMYLDRIFNFKPVRLHYRKKPEVIFSDNYQVESKLLSKPKFPSKVCSSSNILNKNSTLPKIENKTNDSIDNSLETSSSSTIDSKPIIATRNNVGNQFTCFQVLQQTL